MNLSLLPATAPAILLLALLLPIPAPAAAPLSDLDSARQTGWEAAMAVVEKLEQGNQKDFPGLQAWLKDFRRQTKGLDPKAAPEKWPKVDVDALLPHNGNFWRAHYEVAPGDPGMALLHAGVLLGCGEATRAKHVLEFYQFRPGIPRSVRGVMSALNKATSQARRPSDALTEEGIELFDKGDYAAAVKKYREALKLWPQNGWTWYELGYTLRTQEHVAAGVKPLPQDSVRVNEQVKVPFSAEVKEAFAQSRRYTPLQFMAYQGDDQAVIQGFMALMKKVMPAMKTLGEADDPAAADRAMKQVSEGCQEAGIHEMALVSRQIVVARRGWYLPADHPFITASLQKLAPGPETEATLKRLAGGKMAFRQLIPTEAAEEAKPDP